MVGFDPEYGGSVLLLNTRQVAMTTTFIAVVPKVCGYSVLSGQLHAPTDLPLSSKPLVNIQCAREPA